MAACWIEITMTNGTNGSFTQKCYGKEQWPALLHISPKKYACAVQLPSNHKDIMFSLVNVNCLTALCIYVFCIHNACIYCIHTISQCPLPHSSYCWSDGRSLSQLCRWLPTVFCMFSMCFCKSPLGAWFPLTMAVHSNFPQVWLRKVFPCLSTSSHVCRDRVLDLQTLVETEQICFAFADSLTPKLGTKITPTLQKISSHGAAWSSTKYWKA